MKDIHYVIHYDPASLVGHCSHVQIHLKTSVIAWASLYFDVLASAVRMSHL